LTVPVALAAVTLWGGKIRLINRITALFTFSLLPVFACMFFHTAECGEIGLDCSLFAGLTTADGEGPSYGPKPMAVFGGSLSPYYRFGPHFSLSLEAGVGHNFKSGHEGLYYYSAHTLVSGMPQVSYFIIPEAGLFPVITAGAGMGVLLSGYGQKNFAVLMAGAGMYRRGGWFRGIRLGYTRIFTKAFERYDTFDVRGVVTLWRRRDV